MLAATRACCSTREYLITIAGPVRLVLFYDAGQVRDDGEYIRWRLHASTGAEIRFFMPVLNVPFRLIFARNINYREHPRQQPLADQEVTLPVCGGIDLLAARRLVGKLMRYQHAGLY